MDLLLLKLLVLVLLKTTWGFSPVSVARRHGGWAGKTCRRRNLSLPTDETTTDKDDGFIIADKLVSSLDLAPLLQHVAAHAGMRRTRQAFLSLVNLQEDRAHAVSWGVSSSSTSPSSSVSAKKRRVENYRLSSQTKRRRREKLRIPIAASAVEAGRAYELVEQATLTLEQQKHDSNLTFPPLYESNPFDTRTIALTDDDDWIEFSSSDDWTLEHIVQAEQVIGTILRVYEWSQFDGVRTWAPLLAEIVSNIDVDALRAVEEEIKGSVNICRVRSIADPKGRSTFSFELNESKYKVMSIMREKQQKLQRKDIGNPKYESELLEIEEEIQAKERDIKLGLVQVVSNKLDAIDQALYSMAELDSIFVRAAFGMRLNGHIPKVGTEMNIDIQGFIHPLLTLEQEVGPIDAVPINLKLNGNKHALVITGPNGGGKTLAMKGFGLAIILCKLGIPIPVQLQKERSRRGVPGPRVDFFDHVLVSIGDGQDLEHGESTFTSQMSTLASIVNRIRDDGSSAGYLVLMDELGSGTEANAGSAIAQAVLEELCLHESCRLIATTHSTRLKVLAHGCDKVECAAVLLKPNEARWKLPSFQLQYGVIGESYAFSAASRSHPPLPEDVLARAQALMSKDAPENSESSSYNVALSQSLQHQVDLATQARERAWEHELETAMIQRAMIQLASAYDRNLGFLEKRVEACYEKLRKDATIDSLEILGETLGELRVVRKQVKSEKELLRDQGLKLLPKDHQLQMGESVVVVAEGEWEGTCAEVVSVDTSQQNIVVLPSLAFVQTNLMEESMKETLVLKRNQLAIWDFDSVWEDDSGHEIEQFPAAESKRRLSSILAGLKSPTPMAESTKSAQNNFKSSRERKASRRMNRKK